VNKLHIFYVISHDGGFPGAVVNGIITENYVATIAKDGFLGKLKSTNWEIEIIKGKLTQQVKTLTDKIKKIKEQKIPWVTVELCFNTTPLEDCPNKNCYVMLGAKVIPRQIHQGTPCVTCGTPSSTKWKFGHSCTVRRDSANSSFLGNSILESLCRYMPHSTRLPLVQVPSENNPGGKLVRDVPAPLAIIKAGYSNDPFFIDWISDKKNQMAYGFAVAEGILNWSKYFVTVDIDKWSN
jgi:hypothetical protein